MAELSQFANFQEAPVPQLKRIYFWETSDLQLRRSVMPTCPSCHYETTGAFCTNCGAGQNPSSHALQAVGPKVALIGSAIAGVGVFLPVLRAPVVGEVSYFLNGHGDGVFILIAAAISAIAAYAGYTTLCVICGLVTSGFLTLYYVHVQSLLGGAERDVQQNGGLFAGLGQMLIQSVQIEYGFYVMVVGGVLMVIGAFLPKAQSQ